MVDDLNITLIIAIIGAVCGVSGAILGVMNTWHQLRQNRIRLRIIPQHVFPVGAIGISHVNFGIEVINLSDFPVVITDVGFLLHDGQRATLSPVRGIETNGSLPLRLDPRTSYSKWFYMDQSILDYSATKCVYARTQCGNVVRGNSPALRQLLKGL